MPLIVRLDKIELTVGPGLFGFYYLQVRRPSATYVVAHCLGVKVENPGSN